MVYRRDLIPHFEWLAGSKYFDEVLDEAVVAIAMTAHGYGEELVESGAAWMWADGLVERFGLEHFVEQARSELLLPPGSPTSNW
jgi:hypothetical protein